MKPGIHRLSMEAYLADPCDVPSLSSGCAFRLIAESPLHAWSAHPRLGKRASAPTNASDTGSLAHDLLLGGEKRICVIDPRDYPSKPTKDNPEGGIPKGWTNTAIRAARDEARSNSLVPVLLSDLFGVRTMVDAAKEYIAHSEIAGIFDNGECELTVIAQEGNTFMRTRPDWLNDNVSLSYKTTETDISPKGFSRLMNNMGYGFSLAFYERVMLAVEPEQARHHVILVQQQRVPYACALYDLTPVKAAIERGRVDRAVRLWSQCMKTNTWPGYSPRVCSIDATPWELAEEEELANA